MCRIVADYINNFLWRWSLILAQDAQPGGEHKPTFGLRGKQSKWPRETGASENRVWSLREKKNTVTDLRSKAVVPSIRQSKMATILPLECCSVYSPVWFFRSGTTGAGRRGWMLLSPAAGGAST
jgi:hypothetical protein